MSPLLQGKRKLLLCIPPPTPMTLWWMALTYALRCPQIGFGYENQDFGILNSLFPYKIFWLYVQNTYFEIHYVFVLSCSYEFRRPALWPEMRGEKAGWRRVSQHNLQVLLLPPLSCGELLMSPGLAGKIGARRRAFESRNEWMNEWVTWPPGFFPPIK